MDLPAAGAAVGSTQPVLACKTRHQPPGLGATLLVSQLMKYSQEESGHLTPLGSPGRKEGSDGNYSTYTLYNLHLLLSGEQAIYHPTILGRSSDQKRSPYKHKPRYNPKI